MDVHSPRQPLRTWRDFWIHLGMITAGLLIAFGLEASVEWLHYLHQRQQLEGALHEEALKNKSFLEQNFEVLDCYIAWLDGLQRELIAPRGSQNKRGFVFPEGSDGKLGEMANYVSTRVSVWRTAQTTGLTGLLPRETAQFHTRLYSQLDAVHELALRLFEATQARVTYQSTFASVERRTVPEIADDDA